MKEILFCVNCLNDINSEIGACIEKHKYLEEIPNRLKNLVNTLIDAYEKENIFNEKLNQLKSISSCLNSVNSGDKTLVSCFDILVSTFVLFITKLIKLYTKMLLEKYKGIYALNDNNISDYQLNKSLLTINLFYIFEDCIKDEIREEINHKIIQFSVNYDREILNELLK